MVTLRLYNRAGVIPGDAELAAWLRTKTQAHILLAANKCERRGPHGSGACAQTCFCWKHKNSQPQK